MKLIKLLKGIWQIFFYLLDRICMGFWYEPLHCWRNSHNFHITTLWRSHLAHVHIYVLKERKINIFPSIFFSRIFTFSLLFPAWFLLNMDLEIKIRCLFFKEPTCNKNIWIIKLKPVSISTSDGVFLSVEKDGGHSALPFCLWVFFVRIPCRFDQANKKISIIYTLNCILFLLQILLFVHRSL